MKTKEIVAMLSEKLINDLLPQIKFLPKIKRLRFPKAKGDPEHFVLLVSDLQAGHKTKSFNLRILGERVKRLVKHTLLVTDLHRRSHPVPRLSIFLMGDLIQHERIGALVSLDELEDTVKVQLFDAVIPYLTEAIYTLAGEFEEIDIYCVRGNHGSYGKFAATTTNWDDVAYRFLEMSFKKSDHIKFHIADNFYQLAEIEGYKFLMLHGDDIRSWMNLPWYGVTQKAMRWYQSIVHFDYLCLGHFHTFAAFDWNNTEIIMNGTFCTDDAYALKKLGMGGTPKQILFSVHKDYGVVFLRKIFLEGKK